MCGRYNLSVDGAAIAESLGAAMHGDWSPHYNVAPSLSAPVLRRALDGSRHLHLLRWGLLPSWAKDTRVAYRMINARAESLSEKPAYRGAARRRRCIVPMTGYYEWQARDGHKQPYNIAHARQPLLLAAGLWEENSELNLRTFTVVTRDAPAPLNAIHDRMPLFVATEHLEMWLNHTLCDADEALEALYTATIPLRAWPVSTDVGNVRNNSPDLRVPTAPERVSLD